MRVLTGLPVGVLRTINQYLASRLHGRVSTLCDQIRGIEAAGESHNDGCEAPTSHLVDGSALPAALSPTVNGHVCAASVGNSHAEAPVIKWLLGAIRLVARGRQYVIDFQPVRIHLNPA